MENVGDISTNVVPLRQRIANAYRETFSTVLRSPVTWLIVALTLIACAYMVLAGRTNVMLSGLTSLVVNSVFALATIPLTIGKPKAPWESPPTTYSRQRLWVQVGMCVLLVLLLQVFLIFSYDLLGLRHALFPLLTPLVAFMYAQLMAHNLLFILSMLFLLETVLPLGLMRLLGATWQELGFCKGYHSGRVTLLLSFIYPIIFVVALLLGQTTIVALLISIVVNFFLDGLVEETLFRGVIMTRLTQLFGVAWGVGLSGIVFGLGHFSITMHTFNNNVPLAFSFVMVHYVLNGIFAAFFLLRTRNLTALVISHTLGDAAIPFIPL